MGREGVPMAARSSARRAAPLLALLSLCGCWYWEPEKPDGPPRLAVETELTVAPGDWVTLDAFAYGYPPVDFQGWSGAPGTPPLTLFEDGANAVFRAPDAAGDLAFRFSATNAVGTSTETAMVHVRAPQAGGALSLTPAAFPVRPVAGEPVAVVATLGGADPLYVALRYTWAVNGAPVGAISSVLPASLVRAGDRLEVTVFARTSADWASTSAAVTAVPRVERTLRPGETSAVQLEAPAGAPSGPWTVVHGPSGLAVTSAGLLGWTAATPFVGTGLDLTWAAEVTGHHETRCAGTFHVADASRPAVAPLATPGPTHAVQGGLVARAGAGARRLAFQSFREGDGAEIADLLLLDPASGALTTVPALGQSPLRGRGLAVVDADGDGADEVLVATAIGGSGPAAPLQGRLTSVRSSTGEIAWTASPEPQVVRVDLAAGDLTGDGHPWLVALTAGGRVEVRDPRDGALRWLGPTIGGDGRALALADLDGTGRADILALTDLRLVRYRWNGGDAWSASASLDLYDGTALVASPALAGAPGAAGVFVLLPTSGYGTLLRLDAALAEASRLDLAGAAADLALEPSPTGRSNPVLALDDRQVGPPFAYRVVALDALSGRRIWETPARFPGLGPRSLSFVSLDDAGAPGLVIGGAAGIWLAR